MATGKNPAWMKVNDDGTVTVTLTKPVEINGAQVGYVVMREPTVEDHVLSNDARGSELTKEIGLFANLCTIAPTDLRKLPMRDYMRLQAAYTSSFFD